MPNCASVCKSLPQNNFVKTLLSSPLKKYFDTLGWKIPSAKTRDCSISCTKYFKYSGTCCATKGSALSPSYATNYPLTAEFTKSCWFLTPQRHRRKKKNLMIRPRFFLSSHPFPQGSNCSFLKDILTHPGTTFCLHTYVQLQYHRYVLL